MYKNREKSKMVEYRQIRSGKIPGKILPLLIRCSCGKFFIKNCKYRKMKGFNCLWESKE